MLLGYRLADPYDAGDLEGLPAVVRPMVELESLVPGSWYINALATLEGERGLGVGSRLLELAHVLARASGATRLSIIVARENEGAARLYARCGYAPQASRPVVPYPGLVLGGDWVLMSREV